jgi:hypothetical protein
MSLLCAVLVLFLGGVGAAFSFWIPHNERWSSDHAMGAGWTGIFWMLICAGIAFRLTFI